MKKLRGFSVIEVLVVVSIITILATIGLSTYSSIQKKARDGKRMSDLELIRAAVEQYRSNNNQYPPALIYPNSGGNTGLCDPPFLGGCTSGVYTQKIPADPDTSHKYSYELIGTSDYTICAYLTNPGTSNQGNCAVSGTLTCNYCLGPYGQK